MFLLVPAHPGSPRQKSCKMIIVVVVVLLLFTGHFPSERESGGSILDPLPPSVLGLVEYVKFH